MTVEELIEELQKIEDKTQIAYFDDEEWGIRKVNEVILSDKFHGELTVVLKN